MSFWCQMIALGSRIKGNLPEFHWCLFPIQKSTQGQPKHIRLIFLRLHSCLMLKSYVFMFFMYIWKWYHHSDRTVEIYASQEWLFAVHFVLLSEGLKMNAFWTRMSSLPYSTFHGFAEYPTDTVRAWLISYPLHDMLQLKPGCHMVSLKCSVGLVVFGYSASF